MLQGEEILSQRSQESEDDDDDDDEEQRSPLPQEESEDEVPANSRVILSSETGIGFAPSRFVPILLFVLITYDNKLMLFIYSWYFLT